ncbi:NmrA family NAD(P)-binding protein [Marinilactibacillus piezotolerans]|uniref:NmrA family NAD(P)-binding protein n=1 Tax=Marinilactibacillus piezotolerans TaxID=258723 RepID=UPI0009B14419|nr:NmrA family NAD(P)-binding protein [Marinilactibacillus piezotolerans]
MTKYIVTGVDGNFGGYVAEHITSLTDKENLIFTCPFEAGLEKFKAEGFDTRVANFNHPETLEEAFKGGDALLIISAPFVGKKRQQAHKNAVDAAKKAGVSRILYTSLVNAQDPENPSVEKVDHAVTEQYIEQSGLDYVFLRNSQYAEAMITIYFTSADSDGVLANNAGDGQMPFISRRDCAKAAMHALVNDELKNTILNINGPESMTMSEFVAIGNEQTGRKVTYKATTDEENYEVFDALGVPRTTDGDFQDDSPAPYSSEGMVTFGQAIREGKLSTFTDDFEKLVGEKPRTVAHMFAHADEYQVGRRNSTDD